MAVGRTDAMHAILSRKHRRLRHAGALFAIVLRLIKLAILETEHKLNAFCLVGISPPTMCKYSNFSVSTQLRGGYFFHVLCVKVINNKK